MSYLEEVLAPPNSIKLVSFNFLVDQLFTKFDGVHKENLGVFPNITSKKSWVIEQFVRQWKEFIGPDILPAARLIFPNKDHRLYFIKHVTLARLFIKLFHIPKNSLDYHQLLDYKQNYHGYKHMNRYGQKQLRSLPLIVAQVVSERRDPLNVVKPTVTIDEVNEVLDELSSPEATKSETQLAILEPLILRLTIAEVRWFVTILIRSSILNSFESVFLRNWHADAPLLFGVCNSLSKVFWLLTDPEKRLTADQLKIQIMFPFVPQLSLKLSFSYEELCQRMNYEFFVEEKMDGDRMVMHMNGGKFKFYSRRPKDYTLLYGSNYHAGSLTKHLAGAFDSRVRSIVLDGEMLAWDYKRNVILPFGTLKVSAVQNAVRQFTTTDVYDSQSSWPLFISFDVVYLNGKDLTEYPLYYRKQIMQELIRPVPHKFELLRSIKCTSVTEIQQAMKDIISDRSEGIMVKNTLLKYHVASRNNSWVKIKPEYLEQFGENLDLVVIGVIPAIKNSYMCGLMDPEDGGCYKSFCTVANGFTNFEYDKIERLTTGKWHNFKLDPPPSDLLKFGAKKPVMWIHPKDSVVLEIRARALDSKPLDTYAVGTTLHNLFCRCIREDKLYDECITLTEYHEIKLKYFNQVDKSQSVIKNRKRFINSFEEEVRAKKTRPNQPLSLVFNGINFVILTDHVTPLSKRVAINEIKDIVKSHGGDVCPNTRSFTRLKANVILSEKLTPKCLSLVAKGFDLIKPAWVFDCLDRGGLVPLEPSHIFKTNNQSLCDDADKRTDEYGDSFILNPKLPLVEYTNFLKNTKSFTSLERHGYRDSFEQELKSWEVDLPSAFLFQKLKFYIVAVPHTPDYVSKLLQLKIERYNGQTTNELSSCSFVVVPSTLDSSASCSCSKDALTAAVSNLAKDISKTVEFEPNDPAMKTKIPHIVKESFVDDSITYNSLVDPQDHIFV